MSDPTPNLAAFERGGRGSDALYSDDMLVAAYDALNSGRADFEYYASKLPPAPQRILDVGCGTGRFAIMLAGLGHDVEAVDPSAEMLAVAQNRDGAGRVRWRQGTIDAVASGPGFDAIFMTGHAFQCLLLDAEILQFFAAARSVLSPNGALHFETRNPDARAWRRWVPEHAADPVTLGDAGTVQVTHQLLHVDGEIVEFEETYVFQPSGVTRRSASALRFAGRDRIVDLAGQAGLKVTDIVGDWDGRAADNARCPELIFRLSSGAV